MATTTTATVKEIAEELVSLCRSGKNLDAIARLYSTDIVSIEPMGTPEMPKMMTGIDAVRAKNQWWFDHNEIHKAEIAGPFVGEGQFATHNRYETTFKPTNRRMAMSEMALYTVRDGKIVEEEFFYHMPG